MPSIQRLIVLAALAAAAVAQQPGADRRPAFLGVSLAPLMEETRAQFSIPKDIQSGVVLIQVVDDSAADKAGFKQGDVLISFAGESIRTPEELAEAVSARQAGDQVAYVLRRGPGTILGKLTLGERPAGPESEAVPERPRPEHLGDVEERVERARAELEELRERVLKRRAQAERADAGAKRARAKVRMRRGDGLEPWLAREEKGLAAARKAGDAEKVRWHTARLSVLRELRKQGARAPGDQRLQRIEKKLDAILALLKKRD